MFVVTSYHLFSGVCLYSFKWDADKFAPDFSISPTEGYLSPGMEVYTCTVYVQSKCSVQFRGTASYYVLLFAGSFGHHISPSKGGSGHLPGENLL